jgi:divalent anion:Na+ symporter, DASS family
MKRPYSFLIPALIYAVTYLCIPCPEALSKEAWHLFAIFSCTIASLITKPFHIGTVSILSLTAVTATGVVSLERAMSAFASPLIWLILLVCLMAKGIMNVRLNERIAYMFALHFGKGVTGISYSLVLTDTILSPFIPSTVAKAGGIMMPVFNSIASFPSDRIQAANLRNFLSLLYAQVMCVTGAMFLTGTSGNPLIYNIAAEQGVSIGWTLWAKAAIVPALLSLLIIPHVVLRLSPLRLDPRLNFQKLAAEKLAHMGPMGSKQVIVLVALLLMLALWVVGPRWGINNIAAALLGLSVLLVSNILTFEELAAEKSAWSMFLWFSIIVMLAQSLQSAGVIAYFSGLLQKVIPSGSWQVGLLCITLVYFYSHYFFAGAVAHISSMYGVFLSIALALGSPPVIAALALAFASGLFMSLTHYSAASTAILYSNTSISVAKWWSVGFIVSLVNLIIWASVGPIWWRFLGIW